MPFTGKWVDPETAIAEGVRLFNRGEFYEVHEVLEEAWRFASGEMKQFLKGLIHAAVAFYQYGRRNLVGARSKYHSTHLYLGPYSPTFAGIDVARLLSAMDTFFASILGEGKPGWLPDESPRPRLHLL